MKKLKYKALCITAASMLLGGAASIPTAAAVSETTSPPYLRSVTYASDAWVINFWNTESDNMEAELNQIAADGFNSIILAIPWREFQPTLNPVSYSDYAFDKLERIMRAAQERGLWVKLRVSYTWDYYPKKDVKTYFRSVLEKGETRKAWVAYVKTLYDVCSEYSNFCGGFLTWEDFWNYVADVPRESKSSRKQEAERIGYLDYLREHYSLETLNLYYKENFSDYASFYIPTADSPAYRLFYEYYDVLLMELLEAGQEVFPDLSMEVRFDVDPVNGLDGTKVGAHHFATFPCKNASHTALMYSVSMGQNNCGEKIDANSALAYMKQNMKHIRTYNENKPIYIDQLLYMDMTEAFSYNAQLYEEERSAYLLGIEPILREYTNGYAVWSYRNYTNNPLYNCQFALGTSGWEISGGEVYEHDGSNQMYLKRGGSLSQQIKNRLEGTDTHDNIVRFTAQSSTPVTISVTLGRKTKEITVMEKGIYELNFGKLDCDKLSFRVNGDVYLDNIEVYNFIQDGQLYGIDGEELSCLEPIRQLNSMLARE